MRSRPDHDRGQLEHRRPDRRLSDSIRNATPARSATRSSWSTTARATARSTTCGSAGPTYDDRQRRERRILPSQQPRHPRQLRTDRPVGQHRRPAAAGIVTTLLDHFADDPWAAVVGPRLVYGDGRFQRWTAGRIPSLGAAATFFLGLDRLHPWRRRGLYLGSRRGSGLPARVGVERRHGGTPVRAGRDRTARRADLRLHGRRRPVRPAVAAGWHVWYAAETTATHFMGASSNRATGQVSPEALRAFNRWYVRRHGATSGPALRVVELMGFGARVVHSLPSSRDPPARRRRATPATSGWPWSRSMPDHRRTIRSPMHSG